MPRSMHIGNKTIGEGHPCFIIAEAGVNHNGSVDLAKKLVDAAAMAGVDAIKFQTFKTDDVIMAGIEKAPYQKKTTSADETQTDMLKRLEMDKAFHMEVMAHCARRGVLFLSTCVEEASLQLLVELGLPALKIASMDTANPMFLENVARTGKPVIASTGMCSQAEIEQAVQCLKKNGCPELALLKCTSNYPTAPDQVHLRGMLTLKERFDAVIGFSDHTQGLGASPYAVAMGAEIVEKHFTLDKDLPGPDHQSSLSPDELVAWVKEIRRVEEMLGSAALRPTGSEQETIKALRRCLVSRKDLKKGDKVSRDNVTTKRTSGEGISSADFYQALGLELMNDLPKDRPVHWAHLGK